MTQDELIDGLKAVAHPVRLRILQTLSGVERNVGEIDDAAALADAVAAALASTGQVMDAVLATAVVIAVGFQLLMMRRHHHLLLSLVEERYRSAELARHDPLTGLIGK